MVLGTSMNGSPCCRVSWMRSPLLRRTTLSVLNLPPLPLPSPCLSQSTRRHPRRGQRRNCSLLLQKRMQAELNKVEKKKKKDKREGACGKPAEGNQVSEAGEASGSKQSKKKRKAHDGPVMHAYREFIADCRQGGLSFRQSVEALEGQPRTGKVDLPNE